MNTLARLTELVLTGKLHPLVLSFFHDSYPELIEPFMTWLDFHHPETKELGLGGLYSNFLWIDDFLLAITISDEKRLEARGVLERRYNKYNVYSE